MAAVTMAHQHRRENRIHQLEDLANKSQQHEGRYGTLRTGEMSVRNSGIGSAIGATQFVPVPVTLKEQIGSPTALGIGAFATTLTMLSLALMEFRGVKITNVFIGNFFFVAGIGMLISGNWELVLGNTYAYTVLSAYGLFYGGYGAIITPFFGVAASYTSVDSPEYNNAIGFFFLIWSIWNLVFLIGSLPLNLVYISIFFFVECAFVLVAASYFLQADGHMSTATAVRKASGAFGFVAGMLGYYYICNLMLSEAMFFSFPMGDTSRFFLPKEERASGEVQQVRIAPTGDA